MKNKKKILILAFKRLSRNTRIVRQIQILGDKNYQVTVACLEPPSKALMNLTPNARYVKINLPSPNLTLILKEKICKRIINPIRRLKCTLLNRHLSQFLRPIPTGLINRNNSNNKSNPLGLLISLKPLIRTRQFATKVRETLKEERFDLYHAHDTHSLPAVKKMLKNKKTALIYDAVEIPEHRSAIVQAKQNKWLQKFESWNHQRTIKKADIVFTVGPMLAEWTKKRYNLDEITVLRNCRNFIIPNKNNQIKKDLNIQQTDKLVIFIGSIYEGLGLEHLIESLEFLPKSVHIGILGPESEKGYISSIEKLAMGKGTSKQFHIIEPVPTEHLIDYASGADIGVIAMQAYPINKYYSLPNKVFEMIMARLPIAVGGLPDIQSIVQHYNIGSFFDETNPKSIADTIQEMLKPDNLTVLKDNIERAAQELCWEKEGLIYAQKINQLLDVKNEINN